MKTACLLIGAAAYIHGASIPEVDLSGSPLVGTSAVQNFDWRYDAQTLTGSVGPADWGTITGYELCSGTAAGTSQSPIDIVTSSVVTPTTDIGAITTSLFDASITGALVNTGRVLRWMSTGKAKPTIMGGPLAASKMYALSHIDFHFGSVSTQGSEHTLNGAQSPMEMEMVFYDETFIDTAAAMASTDADALATISHLFSVDTADNDGLTPITSQISSIEFADPTKRRRKREARQGRQASAMVMVDLSVANANLVENVAINITEILGSTSIDNYYYYDGSMTEPVCTENTKWIINKDMKKISEAQLTAMRTLKTNDAGHTDNLQDNFRPVQALNSRTVNQRVAPWSIDETQAQVIGATLVGVGVFNAVNEILSQPEVAKSLVENPLTDFLSNLDLNPFDDASVVQQRSSVEVAPQQVYAPAYPQPVYQQYAAPPAPAH